MPGQLHAVHSITEVFIFLEELVSMEFSLVALLQEVFVGLNVREEILQPHCIF